ncbi:nitrogen fixation protein NifQ [Sedimenticola hydrogenitrophicus]|uniref:nitrogen fixation protein NifQ n=1 Tax=Sedimenticola hydrogenitrophicus TaxID=2967975 RepID=UPI0023B194D8|nr:nitrogen fixation protein NifQ [Sedimenticola hydrogenitrophicus]
MAHAVRAIDSLETVYAGLMAGRRGEPVEKPLARMLASWSVGLGVMPDWLGLGEMPFRRMMARHFPAADPDRVVRLGRPLGFNRHDEREELNQLLLAGRTGASESEVWMAGIVTVGCLGNDHLWQDLGLWSRPDLSQLMLDNFAPLALRNDKNMKWKRFLYKQLCEAEGIYVCRSPSCEVCVDYAKCFVQS